MGQDDLLVLYVFRWTSPVVVISLTCHSSVCPFSRTRDDGKRPQPYRVPEHTESHGRLRFPLDWGQGPRRHLPGAGLLLQSLAIYTWPRCKQICSGHGEARCNSNYASRYALEIVSPLKSHLCKQICSGNGEPHKISPVQTDMFWEWWGPLQFQPWLSYLLGIRRGLPLSKWNQSRNYPMCSSKLRTFWMNGSNFLHLNRVSPLR